MLSAREVESEPEPLEGRPQIMGDLDREPLGRVLFLQELLRLYLADLGTHLVAIRKACWVAAIEGGERGRRATDTMKRVSEDMWAKSMFTSGSRKTVRYKRERSRRVWHYGRNGLRKVDSACML